MQAYRRWAAAVGVLLLLPLAGAVALSVPWAVAGVGCRGECGDTGRGLFLLMLLCTPPAAAGLLALAATGQRRAPAGQGRRLADRLSLLAMGSVFACVAFCTLLLVTAAIWAGAEGVHQVIREPQIHDIGQTEPSQFDRDQARKAGVFWLVIAALLTAMAITAGLALWAAWQKRRAG